ncbi:uncharacterized protein METZ01_LOCUS110003, partial [marine metagenome]
VSDDEEPTVSPCRSNRIDTASTSIGNHLPYGFRKNSECFRDC